MQFAVFLWSDFTGIFYHHHFIFHRAFVIKEQPPQVMKTNTKFQAEIRSLFSAKLLEAANLQQVSICTFLENLYRNSRSWDQII